MNSRKYNKVYGKLNTTGDAIRIIREQNNLSRQDLSTKLTIIGIDISQQAIYDVEMGLRTITDFELCAFAKVLNTTADFLLTDFRNYLDKF